MMSPTWGPFLYGCLLHLGWAANISRVYLALNDPLLLSIPGYPNAERDQVTWRDGKGNTMGRFKDSISFHQIPGCECELFRNGSLYLKRLGTVGNENYTVTVFNQLGIHLTTVSILVTVIEKVSAPRLNSSCSPDGRALIGCEVEGGTDPQYSWEEDGGNLSPSWNVRGNWMRGFAPVPVTVSCSVWNPVSEERSQRVSVFCPLPVSVPSLTVWCQQDGSARISCRTDSGTDPVFSWRVNGADRQGDPSISGNGTWSQISVPPPAVGNTLCAVSNTISNGSSTQSFSCPVPLSDPVLGVSCESEERALLSCRVLTGSEPQYSWYINGTEIGNSSLKWEVNGTQLSVGLPPPPGNISCTVRNPISNGTVSVSSSFNCSVPVSEPVLEVSCLPNGSALVSCKVESGTSPFYSLIHNGETLRGNSSSPLVNVPVPLSPPGNISCSVRNRFSTRETNVSAVRCQGWAANIGPVYVALNGPVLLSIPGYPNAERDQVTWKDGKGNIMGRFRDSLSFHQTQGCECELFSNGSLYLKQLGTVGDETYKVEVHNQKGNLMKTGSILVTVIERVRSPVLNHSCTGRQIALRCQVPEGPIPTNMKLSWNDKVTEKSGTRTLEITDKVKSGKLSCLVWNHLSRANQSMEIECPKDTPGLDLYIMIAIAGGAVTFLIFIITLIYFVRRRCCHQESRNGEEEGSICLERHPHIQQRQLPSPPTQHDTPAQPPADIPDHKQRPKIPPHGPQAQNCPPTHSKRPAHSKQRGSKFPEQASQQQKHQTPSQAQRPPIPANHPCDQTPHPQPRDKSKPPRKNRRPQ